MPTWKNVTIAQALRNAAEVYVELANEYNKNTQTNYFIPRSFLIFSIPPFVFASRA